MPEQDTVGSITHPVRRRLIQREIGTGPDYWPADVRRGATTDEELFELYVGPNARRFLNLYHALVDGYGRAWSFNWAVFFAGIPWFFYRRMYLPGVGILLVPIVLAFLIPTYAPAISIGLAASMAFWANRYYVSTAIARIDRIKALGLSEEERNDRISEAGGVSAAGAAFGAAIILALVSLPFFTRDAVALPTCDQAQVQEMAETLLKESLQSAGVRAMGLALSEFETVRSAADGSSNICSFRARLGNEEHVLYLGVHWKDRDAGHYEVKLGPSSDEVSS